MLGTKTDKKNIELIKLIAQLRDHIDIYRIIGLNGDSLRNSDISNAFIVYLQKAAQESLAIYCCKIFESSTSYRFVAHILPILAHHSRTVSGESAITTVPCSELSKISCGILKCLLGFFATKFSLAETACAIYSIVRISVCAGCSSASIPREEKAHGSHTLLERRCAGG